MAARRSGCHVDVEPLLCGLFCSACEGQVARSGRVSEELEEGTVMASCCGSSGHALAGAVVRTVCRVKFLPPMQELPLFKCYALHFPNARANQ